LVAFGSLVGLSKYRANVVDAVLRWNRRSGATTNYSYDVNGNLSQRNPGNVTSSTYTYDALDRVTHITHSLVGNTRTFDYGYDNVGNRNWTKREGNVGDVFDYDNNDQVTVVKLNIANPDTTAPGSQTIHYDTNGNRTSFAPYGTTDNYTTNNLNEYTVRNSTSAAYNANADMTTGFDGSPYTYDAQDRLLSATESGVTETFDYDGLNRQVSRTVAGVTTYNVYDGWALIEEYQSGGMAAAYLHGAGGLVKDLTTNNYYYQDGSGSTSHLPDSAGNLLEWYRYDLQGTPVFYNFANTQQSASAYEVRHLFTGQQWYADLGLYDLRNRFYSPDIGRFLQPDPIGFGGDATNLYRYCGNNPLARSDPNGTVAIRRRDQGGGDSLDYGYRGGDGTAGVYFGLMGYDWSYNDLGMLQTEQYQSLYGVSFSTAMARNGYTSVGGIIMRQFIPKARDAQTGQYANGSTPGAPNLGSIGKEIGGVGDVIGKILNVPNDIVGLGLGVLGLPFGGEQWGVGHNGIEITGNRLVSFAPAITFGNVTNYGPGSFPTDQGQSYIYDNIVTGFHEEGHTYQGQIYGPFFIPAYILGQVFKGLFPYVSPFTGSHVNPFEAGADNYAFGRGP
jgi:RHS repeat-associated protein